MIIVKLYYFIKNKIEWYLMPITRDKLINELISKFGFSSYLEIGVDNGSNFKKINCLNKESVDPAEGEYQYAQPTYKFTSDYFFKKVINKSTKYDVIFIDGLHHEDQVDRDIQNSIKHLNVNGFIILHDCNPLKKIHQQIPRISKQWNGDVWKSIVKFRNSKHDFGCITINSDQGLGVISKRLIKKSISLKDELTYENLEKNRDLWLGLISYYEFKKLVYK